jgi:rhamnosyltransferase
MANCAIYTLFNPTKIFFENLYALSADFDLVVLVDNTPAGANLAKLPSNVVVHSDGINKGIAKALNIGIQIAVENKIDHILLFDQDSTPSQNLVDGLLNALFRFGDDAVIIGPTHVDDQVVDMQISPVISSSATSFEEVSCLPTSGIAFKLANNISSFNFDERLFLDLVDFDWCWRLRSAGWRIFRARNIKMLHRLGEAEKSILGLNYHIPATYRHYYQFRDTLNLVLRKYVPLRAKLRLAGILPIKFFFYPFVLDSGRERLKWMIYGVYSFLLGHKGIGLCEKRLSRKLNE